MVGRGEKAGSGAGEMASCEGEEAVGSGGGSGGLQGRQVVGSGRGLGEGERWAWGNGQGGSWGWTGHEQWGGNGGHSTRERGTLPRGRRVDGERRDV